MVVPLRRRQAASEVESVVSTLPHPSPEAVQRLLTVTSTVLESAIQAGVDDLDTDSLPCDVLELLSERNVALGAGYVPALLCRLSVQVGEDIEGTDATPTSRHCPPGPEVSQQ